MELVTSGVSNMLNASAIDESKRPANIIEDSFLSIMTALFIEGMAIEPCKGQSQDLAAGHSHQLDINEDIPDFPLSYTKETEAIALKEYGTRKAEPHNKNRRTRVDQTTKTIREFILGLSDAFNNLLMGIWGNLSLINLSTDKNNPLSQRVSEMEQLIQNGSALLNGIFGYLGERRIVAKNIRLNQLLREIKESVPIDSSVFKSDILQESKIDLSGQSTATMVASGLARVLAQLMERMQHHHHLIRNEDPLTNQNRNRLRTIERLMAKALDIIRRLQYYAEMTECTLKKISVKALTEQVFRKFASNHQRLKISMDVAPRLPRIYADRSMLHFVLNVLMQNAVDAMPENGDLHVDVRALSSEIPSNRCVAYRWADSIVVTVTDTGHGMALDTLLHVFDPFFTSHRNADRLGMGLASAWGIIKVHGGYIHVQSKIGHGSTFKIYLPIR